MPFNKVQGSLETLLTMAIAFRKLAMKNAKLKDKLAEFSNKKYAGTLWKKEQSKEMDILIPQGTSESKMEM
jgi:hypothetical protein